MKIEGRVDRDVFYQEGTNTIELNKSQSIACDSCFRLLFKSLSPVTPVNAHDAEEVQEVAIREQWNVSNNGTVAKCSDCKRKELIC